MIVPFVMSALKCCQFLTCYKLHCIKLPWKQKCNNTLLGILAEPVGDLSDEQMELV